MVDFLERIEVVVYVVPSFGVLIRQQNVPVVSVSLLDSVQFE